MANRFLTENECFHIMYSLQSFRIHKSEQRKQTCLDCLDKICLKISRNTVTKLVTTGNSFWAKGYPKVSLDWHTEIGPTLTCPWSHTPNLGTVAGIIEAPWTAPSKMGRDAQDYASVAHTAPGLSQTTLKAETTPKWFQAGPQLPKRLHI